MGMDAQRRPLKFDNAVIPVEHRKLEKFSPESAYKALCPECGGLLLVTRDPKTLRLQRHDRCVRCGQAYEYTDWQIAGEALLPRGS